MTTGKLIGIIVVLYVLYYAGNIIYDLFLKKEKVVEGDDDLEEFHGEVRPVQSEVVQVSQDEVEEMNMPSSYQNNVSVSALDDNQQEQEQEWSEEMLQETTNDLQKRYEEEQRLNNFEGLEDLETKDKKQEGTDAEEKEQNAHSSAEVQIQEEIQEEPVNIVEEPMIVSAPSQEQEENQTDEEFEEELELKKWKMKKKMEDEFKNFFDDKETSLQITANYDGQKVYGIAI